MTDTPVQTSGFVKNVRSGRVLRRTDILMSRPDMIPCDVNGKTEGQHEADIARSNVANTRVRSKFLGNVNTGAMFNYTDILAERSEMISINSVKEWETFKKKGTSPEVIVEAAAPSLGRLKSPVPPAAPPVAVVQPTGSKLSDQVLETSIAALPSIEGLKARAAKTILSEWAESGYQQKLDRRLPLPELVKQCEGLLLPVGSQEAAG
jgi:hypothetical protein